MEKKAKSALANYGVDLVVANLLQSNRYLVEIYSKTSPPFVIKIDQANSDAEIEESLIQYLDSQFTTYLL